MPPLPFSADAPHRTLRFSVLNAAHHGDTSSGSKAFLKRHMSYISFTRLCGKAEVKPRVLLISFLVVSISIPSWNCLFSKKVSSLSSTVVIHLGQWS